MTKTMQILFFILSALVALIFVGTVIELLKHWVGFLAYFLWLLVAPLLSPAMFILPWFDAWVTGSEMNQQLFWIWAVWMVFAVVPYGAISGYFAFKKSRSRWIER